MLIAPLIRRVGQIFDSAEEAARAYSAECRTVLLEELARKREEEEADAEGKENAGGRAGAASSGAGRGVGLGGGGAAATAAAGPRITKLEDHTRLDDDDDDESMSGQHAPGPIGESNEYEVEAILGERRARTSGGGSRLEYQVKWRGFSDPRGTTWELASQLHGVAGFDEALVSFQASA
jgi:hypothetical protein